MGKRFRRIGSAANSAGYTGNRGMGFENALEHSNLLYKQLDVAIVNKRPTPVKIMKSLGRGWVQGFLEKKSTVDFDGILQGGRSIVFEAKEVTSRDAFQLTDIADHQVKYLEDCHRIKGISFLLVNFPTYHETYLLPYESFRFYWNRWKTGNGARGTARITREEFEVYGYEVKAGRVPIDYIPVVRKVWKLDDAA